MADKEVVGKTMLTVLGYFLMIIGAAVVVNLIMFGLARLFGAAGVVGFAILAFVSGVIAIWIPAYQHHSENKKSDKGT